ncbi:hypothetical protein G9A89_004603 [Geosiphon pyriformis]|nr:hypothetical protein G9A89_004603 [Geosiphon pyriformis]
MEFGHQVHPKPEFLELFNNISPTTVTNDKLLTAIFPFKLEELTSTPLFSGAALKEKPIPTMYTDTKVDTHLIKLILDKEEPISSCASESESVFNSDSNSNNVNNENTSFSSTQYSNKNINNSDFNLNSRIYIALPDLSKEQELKWYNDNNKGIMPECVHDTDTGFDLRYLGKKAIKLEPNLCTYIDLKIALKISTTTMIQLASKSSLVKKKSTLEEK